MVEQRRISAGQLNLSNDVITIAIRFDYDTTIRSDYDVSCAPASIRRDSTRAKNEHENFFVVVVS